MYTTLVAPAGALGGSNGAQSGWESLISTLTVPLNGMLIGSGWSLGSWAAYGLSLWILAIGVGAPAGKSLPLCLAGVALAMTAGFIVVVAPSGIGVREAVLVAALAPVLTTSGALAVALVLRLLFTLGDFVAAAAVAPIRIGR